MNSEKFSTNDIQEILERFNPATMQEKFQYKKVCHEFANDSIRFADNASLEEEQARDTYVQILRECKDLQQSEMYQSNADLQTVLSLVPNAAKDAYKKWINLQRQEIIKKIVPNKEFYGSRYTSPLRRRYYNPESLKTGTYTYSYEKPIGTSNNLAGKFVRMFLNSSDNFTDKKADKYSVFTEIEQDTNYGVLLGHTNIQEHAAKDVYTKSIEYTRKETELANKGPLEKVCVINTRANDEEEMVSGKKAEIPVNATDFFDEIRFELDVNSGVIFIVGYEYHTDNEDKLERDIPSQHILGFIPESDSIAPKGINAVTKTNWPIKKSTILFPSAKSPLITQEIVAPRGIQYELPSEKMI